MKLTRLESHHLAAATDLLVEAGLSGSATLPFYLAQPDALLFGAWQNEQLVGTGMAFCMQDRRTGWIGNIAVAPHGRGRGLGAALTEHAVDWLRAQGATPMLIATAMGRPIYERLGFRGIGEYTIWTGQARAQQPEELGFAPLHAADAEALCALDLMATGEDRQHVVRALLAAYGGWGRWENDDLVAFHIPCPWGGGPAIAASPGHAGQLVHVQQALHRSAIVTVRTPAENLEAAAALRAADFAITRSCTRMVLGALAPIWRPERIVSPINLGLG